MTKFVKLLHYRAENIRRGAIFRFPAQYPYEDLVDFMLFDMPDRERPFGLMVTTGYKAGLVCCFLPPQSQGAGGGVGTGWIIRNWNRWIYQDCAVGDVLLSGGYETGPAARGA